MNGSNYQYGGLPHAADTWYPTWSADGNLYTPFTDGTVICQDENGKNYSVGSGSGSSTGNHTTTGYATVIGNDATGLTLTNCGTFVSSAYPYRGRYPCGSLIYNGTWWYGTYLLNATDNNNDGCGNWCEQGPFVGFRWTTDYGKTWTEPRSYLGTINLYKRKIN